MKYRTPSPMGEYNITSARNPSRPSSIPIKVTYSKNVPTRIDDATVQAIFDRIQEFVDTMGNAVINVSQDHVESHDHEVIRIHVDLSMGSQASKLLTTLRDTYLSSSLVGATMVTSGDVRVTWIVSQYPKQTRLVYTEYAKRHLVLQRYGPVIIPFYFSGYMDMTYVSVYCTGIPPETRLRDVLPDHIFSGTQMNRASTTKTSVESEAWTKIHTLVIRVLRAGFWIPGQLDRLGVTISPQGTMRPVLLHTMSIFEIPPAITNDLTARLDRGESLPGHVHVGLDAVGSTEFEVREQVSQNHVSRDPPCFGVCIDT